MKVGLQINSFTWPGGPAEIGPTLARVARNADDAGFDSIWLMDHFFQIRSLGQDTDPMLEGWTTLGWLAAHTSRARLGLLVGGVHYRAPGLWVKAATTLDVLSGGRAWLGLGAAWNRDESEALGFGFPPLAERFDLLEDTLRLAHAMFEADHGTGAPVAGRRLRAGRAINSPQSLSRPRVPILVGGGGEQRTLRLVARYADACNVFGGPVAIHHKYEVLRRHCEVVGRQYDEIERTTLQDVRLGLAPGDRGETPEQVIDRFGELADAGAQHVIVTLKELHKPDRLEAFVEHVLPGLRVL